MINDEYLHEKKKKKHTLGSNLDQLFSTCRILNSIGGIGVFFFQVQVLDHEDYWSNLLIRCFFVTCIMKVNARFSAEAAITQVSPWRRYNRVRITEALYQRMNVAVSDCPSRTVFSAPSNISSGKRLTT